MSREVEDHIGRIYAEIEALKTRHELMFRPGTVAKLDFSDPTKPRARIQHGVDEQGQPVLGPWLPFLSHAGEMNRWNPPTVGMQMMQFAPDGIVENGHLIPFTHSEKVPAPSTDPDRHVSQFGDHREDHGKQDHTRTIGSTSDHQDMNDKRVNVGGKIEHTAGDPAAAASSDAPPAGGLMPHELNRIIQSHTARLGQHDHFLAALHDTMSTMNTMIVPKVPALAALGYKLNNNPTGLQNAANDVLGRLPDYMGQSLLQSVAKLATSFLSGVIEQVQASTVGQLSGLVAQAEAALSGAGLTQAQSDTAASLLASARAAAPAAASGASFELGVQLHGLTNLAAGTPAAAPLADVVGHMRGLMGSTSSLMSGLSGLLDGQVNAAKGTIKSMLLGGYGG